MRPVLNQIKTFDVQSGTQVSFQYGGEVSYASLLKIYNINDFSKPIFTNYTENMSCLNSIPSGILELENGSQYAAEIISYHRDYETDGIEKIIESEPSNKVYFWCYSNPIFEFEDVYDGIIINNQSFQVSLLYEQDQNIEISRAKYEIYNSQLSLIGGSEYWSNYEENNTFNFNGLENNEIYYIRAHGENVKGQILDTGYLSVFIQFSVPSNYSVLYADSDNGNGVIEYYTNIKLIEPNRDRDTYKYDFGFIDLEDDIITYDTNILLNGDFIMAVRHKYTNGTIAKFSNTLRSIVLSIVECSDGRSRYKLSVPNELCNYIIYSDPFEFNDEILSTVWIKRVNNLYELYIFTEKDSSDEYNLFLGQLRPSSDLTKYDVWIDEDYVPTIRIEKDDVVIWKQESEPTIGLKDNDIWIDVDMEE